RGGVLSPTAAQFLEMLLDSWKG
ncbi:MAG: hypothetical protein K0S98_2926, partial [Propionibacteriaceae bacterium]|nr:hypothetical protein [Propionibacteriaceae bacterium]